MKPKNSPENSQMQERTWLQQGQLEANHKTTIKSVLFWEKAAVGRAAPKRTEE